MGDAGAVPDRDSQGAQGGAGGRRHLRRLPHGRVRNHRPGPDRVRQPDHLQRRRRPRGRRGAVLRAALRPGDDRGRLHRLPLRRQGDDRGQRGQHRQGLGPRHWPEARRQCPAPEHLRRGRAARAAGTEGRGAAADGHPGPARRHRVLPLRHRRRGRRALRDLAHRLHRRGWLRALLSRRRHPGDLGRADRPGQGHADRTRRPRFAPSRDGLRPLRQRHRRHAPRRSRRGSAGSSSSTRRAASPAIRC